MAATAPADAAPDTDEIHRVLSTAFDADFYRAIYTDLPADACALQHYRIQGWTEGRDPAPWFSVDAYWAANPDVKARGGEPLTHFLTRGRHEGREVLPSRHAPHYFGHADWAPRAWSYQAFALGPAPTARHVAAAAPALSAAETRAAVASEFDAAFYLALNPDVAAAHMDPLEHFLLAGWGEGRDPSPAFSVHDYLEANPDVGAAGLNPFAHYLLAGRAEGRAARHDLGFRYDVIARLKPVAARIASACAASAAMAIRPAEALVERLAAHGSLADLHLTFSHDNYAESTGGLQLCVRREAARFAELGIQHLHLFPAAPWPVVRAAGEPGPLGVLLNGVSLGVFAPEAVRAALTEAAGPAGRRSFAIHSLLGHEPDATADILAALDLSEGFFWLHDFASLCAGFHLLRNDVVDCAAPPPDSAACGVCAYGPHRARHLDGHRRLFERLALTVVAPSKTTLDFWRAHGDLPARRAVVLPHARLAPRGPVPKVPKDRPFRLAFVGMPVPLKGWPIFRELSQRLADDPRYEFLHLGGRPDPAAPAAFHPVTATGDTPLAMRDAIEALEVDAALIWPLCRETFSFTAYEAAAAGAAVITGPDSGNVAAFAAGSGVGRVLADEAALLEAFQSGAILALSRSRRKAKLSDLVYSGMTGDLVAEPAR